MRGVTQIRTGIITPDASFAAQLREDLASLGFSAIGDGAADDSSVGVILIDCRASTSALQEYESPGNDKIIIAIIEPKLDLPVGILSGVADIIFYPYLKEELYIRITLAASRNGKQSGEVFEWDGFRIDFTNYEVSIDDAKLDLTYKEYELLKHLVLSPGRVFTRSQLLRAIWGYDYIEGARTVDVHIRRLRSKLGTKYASLIETVRHVGYRFKKHSR